MFLAGLIPGPSEPAPEEVGSYIQPLVDTLLTLWHRGVRFSKTYLYPYERLIRAALVCVVCDLPAARKIGGFVAGWKHDVNCAICWNRKKNKQRLPDGRWRRRTNEETREWARRYVEARSRAERDACFSQSGVRCSELLRLPYFDPTRMIVIDSMHNLFLGLFKEHTRNVLGLKSNKKKRDEGGKSMSDD
ncbi:hypothetical protein K435DRAFT_590211, partial [Dendrothele bispora CBS 962.96]